MFEEFLKEIAPYVIVVGSFATYKENPSSDIDCYLRNRPIDEVDLEIGNDTYMDEIIEIINKYDFYSDSVIVGHIAIERQQGVPCMVEISNHYKIPHKHPVFHRIIYQTDFLCAVDNKDASFEDCYDCVEWCDKINDSIIKYPLPKYEKMNLL